MNLELYKKYAINLSNITRYAGSYEASSSYSKILRNQKISEYKLKNELPTIREIEFLESIGHTVVILNTADVIQPALKKISQLKHLNFFIILKLNNDKAFIEIANQKLQIDMIVTNREFSISNYNVISKQKQPMHLNLKDITWEEYNIIESFWTNKHPDDIYFESDFKNPIILTSELDLIKLDNLITPFHELNIFKNRYRLEPFDYSLGVFENKYLSVIERVSELTIEEIVESDFYLIDLLNNVGYLPYEVMRRYFNE